MRSVRWCRAEVFSVNQALKGEGAKTLRGTASLHELQHPRDLLRQARRNGQLAA